MEELRQKFNDYSRFFGEIPYISEYDVRKAFRDWYKAKPKVKVRNMGTGSYLPQNRKDELNRV